MPPVANPDAASVQAGQSVLVDVLANDAGPRLALAGVGTPVHGTASVQDGKLLYAAAADYAGADSVSYTLLDADGLTATAVLAITVTAAPVAPVLPVPPVANPDAASVQAGQSVLVDVLANDAGPGLTLAAVGTPAHGTASVQDGKLLYAAAADYAGPDSVSYTLLDADGLMATAIVSVTVTQAAPPVLGTLTLSSPDVTLTENGPAVAVGIAAPVDSVATALSVAVTALPTDGTITLPDGTVLAAPGPLTVEQLTGLVFTPLSGAFATSSVLSYVVTDGTGNTASGTATFAIGAAIGSPVLAPSNLTATASAGGVPVGIAAPTDPNFAAASLTVTILRLPGNGAVTLADGTVLTGPGQVLSVAQLTGLVFLPGAAAGTDQISYRVSDPAGNSADGTATLVVNPATVSPTGPATPQPPATPTAPTIGVLLDSGLASLAAITSAGAAVVVGTATAGATVTLSGGLGSAVADASGTFRIALPALAVSAAGSALFFTATATLGGTSMTSAAISLLVLPPPGADGVIVADLSSSDIAAHLNAGFALDLPGVQSLQLVDGTLSLGPDTPEAFVQRLYLGLLGRQAEASVVASWVQLLDAGATRADIAADFLASPEYLAQPQPDSAAAFVSATIMAFLGRPASDADLAIYLAPDIQALGRGAIVAGIADSPEAQAYAAPRTAKLFARDAAGTVLHDIYETALGREIELPALAAWKTHLATQSFYAVTGEILSNAEPVAQHAGESSAQFVTDIYQHGLGRAPSADELAAYAGGLDAGRFDRATLVLAVATSPEALAHLTSDMFGQPPVIAPVGTVQAVAGSPVSVALSATDPDGTGSVFSLAGAPPGASVDPATGVFTFTPPAAGTSSITAVATDPSGLSTSLLFSVAALPVQASSGGVPAAAMLLANQLPIAFNSDVPATAVSFRVNYHPEALSIDGAAAADGLPSGSAVAFSTADMPDGRTAAFVTVSAPEPFEPGMLVSLAASLPPGAAAGAGKPMELSILSVNGVAQALPAASGTQALRYGGEAGMLSVVGGADVGTALWRGLAPSDAAAPLALAFRPGGDITVRTLLDSPLLAVPDLIQTSAGGMLTLPVTIGSAGPVTLGYDPAALELSAVRADPGAGLTVDDGAVTDGLVTVRATSPGTLALFEFGVLATLPPDTTLTVSVTGDVAEAARPPAPATPEAAAPTVTMGDGSALADDTDDFDSGMIRNARARLLAGD